MACRKWSPVIFLCVSSACSGLTFELSGGIVDDHGGPLPGAVVYALDDRRDLSVQNGEVLVSEHLPRVLSGPDGAFRFDRLPRTVKVLFVRDLEDRCAFATVMEGATSVQLAIAAPAVLEGQLLRGRAPQAGREIEAALRTDSLLFDCRFKARTNAQGRFRFAGLIGGQYVLRVYQEVPQVGCCFRRVVVNQAEAALDAGDHRELRMGGTDLPMLRGRVVDQAANPLHGVWVSLTPVAPEGPATSGPSSQPASEVVWSDVTDRDGAYAVYDVPPGQYALRCFWRLARNNAGRTLDVTQQVTVEARPQPMGENVCDVSIDLTPFMPLTLGQPSPELRARTLDGREFDLSALRGRVVVVHFYASWCAICGGVLPTYDRLIDRFPGRVAVVGVDLDQTLAKCTDYLADRGLRHPQIFAGPWQESPIRRAFHVADVPTTVIIGPDGKVAQCDLFDDVLENSIAQILSEKH